MFKRLMIVMMIVLFAVPVFGASPTTVKDISLTVHEKNVGGYIAYDQTCNYSYTVSNEEIIPQFQGATIDVYLPAVAATFSMSSSSAADDGDLVVTLIDDNYDIVEETMMVNGLTDVTSTALAFRIIGARLTYDSAAANNTNAGDIYFYQGNTTAAGLPSQMDKVFLMIPVNEGRGTNAQFFVPRNKIAVLYDVELTASADQTFEVTIYSKTFGDYTWIKEETYLSLSGRKNNMVYKFDEKTDIYMSVTGNASAHPDVYAGLRFYTRPE